MRKSPQCSREKVPSAAESFVSEVVLAFYIDIEIEMEGSASLTAILVVQEEGCEALHAIATAAEDDYKQG